MSIDDNIRLKIRQWFIDHMDEEMADAIMKVMPAVPARELATRDDLLGLEERVVLRIAAEIASASSSLTRMILVSILGSITAQVALLLTALNLG